MRLTKLNTCYLITFLVTVICVIGMMIFDELMAGKLGHAQSGPAAIRDITHGIAWTEILHSLTTVALVGPTTLIATLMVRRSNLLNLELQRLVDRDRLTDVATRDFFFVSLAMDSTAYGVSLIVDIDNFKTVNDTYGHLAGDVVIARVAKIMHGELREQDIVCRFGGEEFLIFLHEASTDQGWDIAERIRLAIQDATVATQEGAIKVTVSVGGSLKARLDEIEDTIKRADLCLYSAKEAGRNRTVVEWPQAKGTGLRTAAAAPFAPFGTSDEKAMAS